MVVKRGANLFLAIADRGAEQGRRTGGGVAKGGSTP